MSVRATRGVELCAMADSLPCPTILVGPDRPDLLWLDSTAARAAATVVPDGARWAEIPTDAMV